jgi:branched-chain amino acid transport system ATP-binding protein
VALVPEGRGIFPGLTTRENLAMGGYRRPLGLRALEGEIERVTERLPLLRARLGQRAGSLSGGEQQMLAIARALMGSPRVLLVDELSLGLAPIVVETLYEVLEELRAEEMAVLVVEQYATLALRFADRAYVLEKGQVVLAGIAAELAASPQLLDAYLSSTPVEVS